MWFTITVVNLLGWICFHCHSLCVICNNHTCCYSLAMPGPISSFSFIIIFSYSIFPHQSIDRERYQNGTLLPISLNVKYWYWYTRVLPVCDNSKYETEYCLSLTNVGDTLHRLPVLTETAFVANYLLIKVKFRSNIHYIPTPYFNHKHIFFCSINTN